MTESLKITDSPQPGHVRLSILGNEYDVPRCEASDFAQELAKGTRPNRRHEAKYRPVLDLLEAMGYTLNAPAGKKFDQWLLLDQLDHHFAGEIIGTRQLLTNLPAPGIASTETAMIS